MDRTRNFEISGFDAWHRPGMTVPKLKQRLF
jgi:hypothetical protein